MQTHPIETTFKTDDSSAPAFKHIRSTLEYNDMYALRKEVSEFLQLEHISKEHIDHLLLGLTEILTNLVKHPVHKADHIEIRINFCFVERFLGYSLAFYFTNSRVV